MSRQRKKSKAKFIVLGVLLVLIIALAVAVGTHWDLIRAAKMGLTMDQNAIQVDQEEKDRQIEESLGIEGKITQEMIAAAEAEIAQQINGAGAAQGQTADPSSGEETGAQAAAQTPSGGGAASGGQTTGEGQAAPDGTAPEDIVAKYTAKLYGARGAFQGSLDGLVAAAKAEYLALPEAERNSSARSAIVRARLGDAAALEAQCDAMVETYLQQMEAELKAAGQSTDPVKQLRSYYEEAKVNQKAAYLAQIRGG